MKVWLHRQCSWAYNDRTWGAIGYVLSRLTFAEFLEGDLLEPSIPGHLESTVADTVEWSKCVHAGRRGRTRANACEIAFVDVYSLGTRWSGMYNIGVK